MTATNLSFSSEDRLLSFVMDLDPSFPADYATLFLLKRDHACEPEVMHLMMRALRLGDTAVDVGANVGFFTLLMSTLVGSDGKVVAIEPAPNNAQKLRASLACNATANTEIIEAPAWDVACLRPFYMTQDSGFASLRKTVETISQFDVDVITLDSLFPPRRFPRLIKLDVEGAELHALRGARRILFGGNVKFVVCELNDEALGRFGAHPEMVRAFMRSMGYAPFLLHRDGVIPSMIPRNTEIKPMRGNANILFSTLDAVSEAWPAVEVFA